MIVILWNKLSFWFFRLGRGIWMEVISFYWVFIELDIHSNNLNFENFYLVGSRLFRMMFPKIFISSVFEIFFQLNIF